MLFQERGNAQTCGSVATSLSQIWGCPCSYLIHPAIQQRPEALFPEDKEALPKPETQGSAEALKENEKIVPVAQACAMAAFMLNEWSQCAQYIRELSKKKRKRRRRN